MPDKFDDNYLLNEIRKLHAYSDKLEQWEIQHLEVWPRPVLEFGSAIFFIASDSNLKKLERIQLSAARIIAGLRNSCPNNLVLYECDLQPLNMRRNYCLTKYFNKLLSYGDQHRTSQYLKHWKVNQRLKRNSPFSQALAQNLSFNVEHHCLTSFINPVGLQRVTFHYNIMPNVNKMSDHPELLKQLALEVIAGIPLDAAKIYTDGSKGETNTTGSGVLIELPGRVIKLQKRNSDHASPIIHPTFIELAIYRRQHQQEYSSPFQQLSDRHPIHLQWVPSHVGLLGNEIADDIAKAAASNPVDSENHMVLTSTEIYSRA
ncbi:uncharacterized protein TNCV_948081 [Trichonephila clavipes]|nr:uncharacterized protein TNCV_948081 [Trichonephila clavipes]